MSLQECEVCGEEVAEVYRCKGCGVLFCRFCGSPSENLCIDCQIEAEEWE